MFNITIAPNLAIGDLPAIIGQSYGLFHKAGLNVTILEKDSKANSKIKVLERQKESLYEVGSADMYNACIWGSVLRMNCSRQKTKVAARRATVFPVAVLVRGDSAIHVPEALAHKRIGVSRFTGSYYMCYRMLKGSIDKMKITTVHSGHPPDRLSALLRGEVDAAVLIEPYISLAEREGCRAVCESRFWGLDLAVERLPDSVLDTYYEVIKESVQLINRDKSAALKAVLQAEGLETAITVDELDIRRFHFVPPKRDASADAHEAEIWMREEGFPLTLD